MFFVKPEATPARQEFYRRLGDHGMAPLWEVLGNLVTPEPRTVYTPYLWRYEEARPMLLEAGGLLTAHEAERRVLVLENPGARGQSRITQSLYAGLQMVLPGEIAPGHRHVAAALRLVIESDGGYTTVNGERVMMRPGDLIFTPSWSWHDHGNLGTQPVIWLDGLDVPMVNLFDASFAERETKGAPAGGNSTPFAFSYADARKMLSQLQQSGAIDASYGVRIPYGDPMRTMGAFLQLLPGGFRGACVRATDATVYCAVEGSGRTCIGSSWLEWGPHDVFVAPSWFPVSHETDGEAVLFGFSDWPAQKALGIWRTGPVGQISDLPAPAGTGRQGR